MVDGSMGFTSPHARDNAYNEVFRYIWGRLGRMDEAKRRSVTEALMADVIEQTQQRLIVSAHGSGNTLQHQLMTTAQEVLARHFRRQGMHRRDAPIIACNTSSRSTLHPVNATQAVTTLPIRPGPCKSYGNSCTELDLITALKRSSAHVYDTVSPVLSPSLRRAKHWLLLLIPGDFDGETQRGAISRL